MMSNIVSIKPAETAVGAFAPNQELLKNAQFSLLRENKQ